MCIPYWQLDTRGRRRFAVGNSALTIGLMLWIFRAHIPVGNDWLDGVCGLLMGLSIGINLLLARRCRAGQEKPVLAPPQ